VAFIGDSFVEGFGAEASDNLPAVFREVAGNAKLSVETLNLGVGGAGLSRYAWLLRDALPLFQPDSALLVLYANDLVPEPWNPAWLSGGPEFGRTRTWEPRLLHVLRERAAGRRVPRRWVEAPFSYLPAEPDPRNPWSHERASARLSRSVSPKIAGAMRGGRFNPALANWFGWAGEALATPVDWTAHLAALDAYAREQGTRLLVVYIPSKSQVTNRYLEFQAEYSPGGRSLTGERFQVHARWLARSSEAHGIPFLDLTPLLRDAESNGPELYWRYDDHLRPRGYRQVGRWIAEWWLAERAG
jgi:lysophospholipase L1-like esterase